MKPDAEDKRGRTSGAWIVDRPRLRELLDRAPSSTIVLCAPAGYGKSTLARQWLAANNLHGAWYQCTRASGDLACLATGLARAIADATGTTFMPLIERLRVTDRPQDEGEVLAEIFLDSLAERPNNLMLVLDDYHLAALNLAAEDFVGRLLVGTELRALVATRTRPRWATTRHFLYGELTEVDASQLAMTEAEVTAVFSSSGRTASDELVSQADGWPAVVGLLALGGSSETKITGSVEQFLEEEVCRVFESDVADALGVLASFQRVNKDLASALLGTGLAERCRRACDAASLLTEFGDGSYEIHPLVRDFLRTAPVAEVARDIPRRAADYCTKHALWDELFDLADRLKSDILLDSLFEFGVRVCLEEGRSESVRRWIQHARIHRHPVLSLPLAEAELALREGLYRQAETLAVEAISSFGTRRRPRAWALSIAGRAAHLGGREAEAVEYYRQAQSVVTTSAERRQAEWGELKSSTDLESHDAVTLLARLRESASQAPEDQVELASKTLILDARLGSLAGLEAARDVLQLTSLVNDPIVRGSFLNTYGYACALAGEYEEATAALEQLEADAREHRLNFVLAYIGFARAVIAVGERRFDDGFKLLADASTEARRTADVHVLASCAAIRARGLIALGRFEEAEACASYHHSSLIGSMRGELLVTRALAHACGGAGAAISRRLLKSAQETSKTVEVTVISACVKAVLACGSENVSADAASSEAAKTARQANYVDGLIASYRGCPELARRIATSDQRQWFRAVLERARDDEIAQVAGFGTRLGSNHLSPREAEVFSLLRMGMSNREIAAKLFISEGTAKIHVRHILEKLGVRSRTEAVLKAPAIH
jgi:LuxR family transcriptional regulator, maltose regulon positive regulatory protein